MAPTRPNVLILMSDEHRFDVAGFAGDTVVRTPTLDRLAEGSAVFTNAYTPSPVCIPARQSLMAGQFPSTTGCRSYGEDLPPGHMTFSRVFTQHGYATTAAGKLHHLGTDQLQGWKRRIGSMSIGDGFVDNKADEYDSYPSPPGMEKWSEAKEVKRAGVGQSHYAVNDEYTVTGARNAITTYFANPTYDRVSTRPLMLKVSLQQPHYPYLADQELFTYYLNRVTPYLDQQVSDHPCLSDLQVRPGVDASEREIRRATAAYYGMVETIDGLYARVLDQLEHVGQNLDEWIIVYTSDHGEMLGQHGVWEKRKFYEASARVPLFIRTPDTIDRPRAVAQNVNTCDVFATLCHLAGLPVPAGLDSRSLVPLLATDEPAAADWVNETVSQFGTEHLMIKHDALKYQYYGERHPEVLFDLEHDPDETANVIDDPRHAAAVERFRARRGQLGYGPIGDADYRNAGYIVGES